MLSKLSAPVLVLNANYEPLNVCTTRRALGLMVSDKASLVLNGRGVILTVSTKFPAPSIIRLVYQIKRPRPTIKLTKQEIFRRDNHICQYCGKRAPKLTIDHVIPRRLGGVHTWENLTTACPTCNHKKGGKTVQQTNMKLINKPYSPKASARYVYNRYLKNHESWLPFIKGW